MHTQASAADAVQTQALRQARRTMVEDHHAPIAENDVEEVESARWLYVAEDRGDRQTSTHGTFEDLCEHAAHEVLDSGTCPIAAYDLDTGAVVELHITTPVVSAAEDQGMSVHPDLTGVR